MGSVADTLITGARATWERATQRPRVVDALVACCFGSLGLADLLSGEGVPGIRDPDTLGVMLVLVAGVALFWRRVAPIAVLMIVTGISCVFYARDYGSFMSVIGLAALYAAVAHEPDRRLAWSAAAVCAGILFGVAAFTVLDHGQGFRYATAISMVGSITAAVVAGGVVRNRERIFVDARARAERAEADRLVEAERAVARERLRIAREMHDVVAHGMSLVAVQAAAAREVAPTDPERAGELMSSVETTGRQALDELRRMLGVLRNGDDTAAALDPQPTLTDLDEAVAQSNAAGVRTQMVVSGERRQLAPGIELAAFRIVQEGLTNVRKHAGNRAAVVVGLDYRRDALAVEIVDDGAGAVSSLASTGAGNGLVGVRERVEIYGGELRAGPQSGGGYRLCATLPLTDNDRGGSVAAAPDLAGPVA